MQGRIPTTLNFVAPGSPTLSGVVAGANFNNQDWAGNAGNPVTPGTGQGQANRTFAATRALTANQVDTLDLTGGGLVDVNGRALDFARVKHILVRAAATNTGAIEVGNATTNAFQGPFSAATGALRLLPGEVLSISNYSAAGWAVTAGTGDILRIANLVAAAASYDIVLVGADA